MKWLLIKRSGNRWGGGCVGWEDKKNRNEFGEIERGEPGEMELIRGAARADKSGRREEEEEEGNR